MTRSVFEALRECRGWPVRDRLFEFATRHKKLLLGAAVVLGAVKYRQFATNRRRREEWNNAGQDVVIVHTIGRSKFCPDPSPFTLKLLTYLKMADIKYKVDFEVPFGEKGKLPWITLNGQDHCDTQFTIERLNKVFKKDFNKNLSTTDRAVARTFRVMVEEHLLWGLALWRFVEDEGKGFISYTNFPWLVGYIMNISIKRRLSKAAFEQGTGRHSEEEIHHIMIKNLEALSNFLGQKKFLMGDEPCEEDCAVFGMLAQLRWQSPGSPYTTAIKDKYKNLDEYCTRMKETFWPDWDSCLLPSLTIASP